MKRRCALALLAGQALAETPHAPPSVRLLFGGDVMLGRYVWLEAQRHKDPARRFRPLANTFREADIAFANLESPFAERPPFFEDRMVFRAHPSMVEGLKFAGFDVVSTANNHVRDAGSRGIEFTLEHLEKNGIAAVGTAKSPADVRKGVVLERKGFRFGFLAYTYDQRNGNHQTDDARVAVMDVKSVASDVGELRRRCDAVIVSMHAGYEYQTQANWQQQAFARTAVDGGAVLVIGHHPHVVQPVERYKDGVIFYSLGNLVFDQEVRKDVRQTAIAEAVFTGAKLSSARLL